MEMSPEEIRRNYNSAKNKRQQIGILADLNCCKRSEIEEIVMVKQDPVIEVEKQAEKTGDRQEPGISEVVDILYVRLDDLEEQIKILEVEYRNTKIAIDVIAKVSVGANDKQKDDT